MRGRREWPSPCDHFVNKHAEAPYISALIHWKPARLLGGHVLSGAHNDTRICLNDGSRCGCLPHLSIEFLCQFSETKIEHLNVSVPTYHDVFRLDVPMDDACLV